MLVQSRLASLLDINDPAFQHRAPYSGAYSKRPIWTAIGTTETQSGDSEMDLLNTIISAIVGIGIGYFGWKFHANELNENGRCGEAISGTSGGI